jgi:hypothetical protein
MSCARPVPFDELVAYWLDEVDREREAQIDEHLLGCGDCAGTLERIADLAGAIRRLAERGAVRTVVSAAFVDRLAAAGIRVNEYRVPRNGGVHCSIAPDDDVAIARLQAPLDGIAKLDLLLLDDAGGPGERLADIPFDAHAGEVVVAPQVAKLRALPASTLRMRLVAVDAEGERLVGEYTFHHTPWSGR